MLKTIITITTFILFIANSFASYNLTHVWNSSFDAEGGNDYFIGIDIDNSNNIYASGRGVVGGTEHYILVKYDTVGNQIWNKSFGITGKSNRGERVEVDSNGDVYVSGYTNHSPADLTIVKYDSDGNHLWNSSYNGGGLDTSRGIGIDSNNNIYAGGYSQVGGLNIFLLVKFDSSGNYVWNRTYNPYGQNGNAIIDLAIDSNDNIIVTGEGNKVGQYNIITIKYNSSGDIIWNQTLDIGSSISSPFIEIDSQDEIYIIGSTGTEFMVIKYDSSGSNLWNTSLFSGTGYAIHVDSSDNVIFGSQDASNAGFQIYDSNGNYLNDYTIPGISMFTDYHYDTNGDLYAVGFSTGANGHIIKYSVENSLSQISFSSNTVHLPFSRTIIPVLIMFIFYFFHNKKNT
jgi:hypothetical protein